MVTFVDRALVAYHDQAAMTGLLTDGGAGPYPRLVRLIASVYPTESVLPSAVSDVVVGDIAPVVRYELLETLSLTNTASQPAYALSEMRGLRRLSGRPVYADLVAQVTLTAEAVRDFGGIDSAAFDPIEDIQSFADFQSRFTYLDLDGFLAEHRITTVEELRSRYQYLRGDLQFSAPTDQAGQPATVVVSVPLACILSEDLSVMDALRRAMDLRAAADAAEVGRTDTLFGPPQHTLALAIVFPAAQLGAGAPTAAQIDAVCADVGVLPLFATPP